MITKEKVEVYVKFKGFYEGFQRKKSIKVNDDEWFIIEELVSESSLVEKNLASEGFKNNLKLKLHNNCDNHNTIEYIREICLLKFY